MSDQTIVRKVLELTQVVGDIYTLLSVDPEATEYYSAMFFAMQAANSARRAEAQPTPGVSVVLPASLEDELMGINAIVNDMILAVDHMRKSEGNHE
jgi:hypothetical protein